jgi:hypothetical protein
MNLNFRRLAGNTWFTATNGFLNLVIVGSVSGALWI